MEMIEKKGRLAFRHEGDYWRCYWAPLDTMEGAVELGSIAMEIVVDQDRKQLFMALMRNYTESLFPVDHWEEPVKAPERERSGHA